ncbi:endonuclease/exonuclease/phosphatase family protein [Nocardia thraciensis]
MRLRIVTINVQSREGDPRRLGALNRELRRLEPDLVALQEVVDTRHLAELLEGTGLRGTHQSEVMAYTPPFADRYGGNAVASRWPHRVVEVLDLRVAGAADVPWCTLAAEVPLPRDPFRESRFRSARRRRVAQRPLRRGRRRGHREGRLINSPSTAGACPDCGLPRYA